MKKDRPPTLQEIEELTAFLPRLYLEGFSLFVSEGSVERRKDGSFTVVFPEYNSVVEEFFQLAASECWDDHKYSPEKTGLMLRDENLIKAASLSQIKTMLTFCVRGERFSDGHWGTMIEEGYIRRLLERLNEIKSE